MILKSLKSSEFTLKNSDLKEGLDCWREFYQGSDIGRKIGGILLLNYRESGAPIPDSL